MNGSRKRIKAKFFRQILGKEPVRQWLLELSKDDRKAIGADIKTVEFGWPIGMPVCRSLGGDILEVRSSLSGKRIARVLFCIEGNVMVLLHGFMKKTQKTPPKEIQLAKKRRKEVLDNGI